MTDRAMTTTNGDDVRLPAPVTGSVRDLLRIPNVQERFREVLADKAPQFIASLANVVYTTPALKDCEPYSVIGAAIVAASLDLPVDKSIGFAHIVPYFDRKRGRQVAQFQLGYKGYIQLALRTGQYRTIHVTEVCAGEVRGVNRMTGELTFGERTSKDVIGFLAYLKMLNGFEKHLYMTTEEVRKHAEKYSKNYGSDKSIWKTNFDAMAKKTVLRGLLGKWGMLSIELRRAMEAEVPPDENGHGPEWTESVVEAGADENQSDPAERHRRAEKAKAALFGDGDEPGGEVEQVHPDVDTEMEQDTTTTPSADDLAGIPIPPEVPEGMVALPWKSMLLVSKDSKPNAQRDAGAFILIMKAFHPDAVLKKQLKKFGVTRLDDLTMENLVRLFSSATDTLAAEGR